MCSKSVGDVVSTCISYIENIFTDFMKRLSLQVENVAKTTASLSSTLMLVASGRMGRVDAASISRKIEEVKQLNEVLPFISKWIDGAVKELSVKDSYGKDLVSPEEIEVMSEFKKAMDILHSTYSELAPIAKSLLHEPSSKSRSLLTNGNLNISALVLLAGKCLQVRQESEEYVKGVTFVTGLSFNFLSHCVVLCSAQFL